MTLALGSYSLAVVAFRTGQTERGKGTNQQSNPSIVLEIQSDPAEAQESVISQESHILMGSFSGRTAWPNFGQIVILHKFRHHAAERGRTCASLQFAHCHAIREEQVVTSTL